VLNAKKKGDTARRITEIAPGGVTFSLETSAHEQSLNDAKAGRAVKPVLIMPDSQL
jgi:hypothetical protein